MAIRSGGNRRRMLLLVILSALFLPACGTLTEVGSTPAAPAAGWGHPQGVVLIIGAHRNAPAPSLDQRLDSPGVDDLEALSVAADAPRSAGAPHAELVLLDSGLDDRGALDFTAPGMVLGPRAPGRENLHQPHDHPGALRQGRSPDRRRPATSPATAPAPRSPASSTTPRSR